MTNYMPSIMLQWFVKDLSGDHQSKDPVPYPDRGMRLIDTDEAFAPGYVYVGTGKDIQTVIDRHPMPSEPILVMCAGECSAMTCGKVPEEMFLICTDLKLSTLYNRIRDCIHKYKLEGNSQEVIRVDKTFKKIIEDIIECRLTDEKDLRSRLMETNMDPSSYFRLLVLSLNEESEVNAVAWNDIIDRMHESFPTCYTSIYGNNIIIIDRNAHRGPRYYVNEQSLLPVLEKNDCYMGIGNISNHLISLPAMYNQTIAGIRYGRMLDPDKRFFYYEDYAMYQIVELAIEASRHIMNSRNPIHLCNNEAVLIMQHDNYQGDNLMDVLTAYLQNDCNATKTSEILYIHRNTLNNKIRKIEEVMGKTLNDPKLRERLRFSCAVHNYQTRILNENPLVLKKNQNGNS